MSTLFNQDALSGRVALITGAASGIGRGIALAFARSGAAVALVDIDSQAGTEARDAILAAGGKALFVQADVGKKRDCVQAIRETVEKFGSVDILVNSAGIMRRATVLETTEEDWDQGMAVNVKSIYLLSSEAIPVMESRGGGVILNIGSGWGLVGGARAALYCASKGAVVQLTRAMALDHGQQNIRVNCICPGDTDTPMLNNEAAQLGLPVSTLQEDAAAYITGTTLVVDGGGLAG